MKKVNIWVKFVLGDLVEVLDNTSTRGIVEKITYDREGLKYDIRTSDQKVCQDVPEEDLR